MNLACRLEPDGGMPGDDNEQRLLNTLVTLAAFVVAGHTLTSGVFRMHVAKLVRYLKTLENQTHPMEIKKVLSAAESGRPLEGDWHDFAKQLHACKQPDAQKVWQALRESVTVTVS